MIQTETNANTKKMSKLQILKLKIKKRAYADSLVFYPFISPTTLSFFEREIKNAPELKEKGISFATDSFSEVDVLLVMGACNTKKESLLNDLIGQMTSLIRTIGFFQDRLTNEEGFCEGIRFDLKKEQNLSKETVIEGILELRKELLEDIYHG